MKQKDAFELLCREYLSKCKESGCDGCIAQIYCIKNNLRKSRKPQEDCPKKLIEYFKQK